MMNRSELLARAEVKKAIAEIRDALRGALPEASFGEREEQGLAINDEALRELLREDLQTMSDDLGDEVLVDGVAYKRHEPGTDTYHSLCGPLEVNRPSYRSVGVHTDRLSLRWSLRLGSSRGPLRLWPTAWRTVT